MSSKTNGHLASIITEHPKELLAGWLERMLSRMVRRDAAAEIEIKPQAMRFLPLLAKSIESDPIANIESGEWKGTRQFLTKISQARAPWIYLDRDSVLCFFPEDTAVCVPAHSAHR